MDVIRIEQGHSDYPTVLLDRLGNAAPSCLYTAGSLATLKNPLLGLVCSIQCPGSLVIKTLDAIRTLRDAGVVVVGGFHSPMERECLDILLRGDQPVILCPARALAGLRIGQGPRRAVKEGRLLVLSPFTENTRRTTATQAVERNNLVAALVDALWVPHAAPGGKTWATVSQALQRGQTICTLDDAENAPIIDSGAMAMNAEDMVNLVGSAIARGNQQKGNWG